MERTDKQGIKHYDPDADDLIVTYEEIFLGDYKTVDAPHEFWQFANKTRSTKSKQELFSEWSEDSANQKFIERWERERKEKRKIFDQQKKMKAKVENTQQIEESQDEERPLVDVQKESEVDRFEKK